MLPILALMDDKELIQACQQAKDIWAKRQSVLEQMQPFEDEAEKLMVEYSSIMRQIKAHVCGDIEK